MARCRSPSRTRRRQGRQPYHGGPGAAICVHLTDHYSFWNTQYHMNLKPGMSAKSHPRQYHRRSDLRRRSSPSRHRARSSQRPAGPCLNLARRIGRPDWVKLTIRENPHRLLSARPRTRHASTIRPVDHRGTNSTPKARSPQSTADVSEIDPDYASKMLEMPAWNHGGKTRALEKIEDRTGHWTSTIEERRRLAAIACPTAS